MASTPTETTTNQSSSPSLEELARAILLPTITGYASSAEPSDRPREVVIIVNPRTLSLTMIEGSLDVFRGKDGRLPASKASIEAMPVVKVAEEGLDCAICLADFEVGEEAKQMPCKHRFHSDCIDKWLGIQGSCPVCRHRMPVEEEETDHKVEVNDDGGDGEEEEAPQDEEEEQEEGSGEGSGRTPGFVFHIFIAPRNRSRSNSGSESGENNDNSGSTGDADGSATQDMEVDSASYSEEMDIE